MTPTAPTPESYPAEQQTRERVIGQGVRWTAQWGLRVLVIAAVFVLAGLIVGRVWGILLPTVLALILTSLLELPARLMRTKLHFPRAVAALVTLVGALMALGVVFVAIAPSLAGQAQEIASSASSGLQKIQDSAQSNAFVTSDQVDLAVQAVQDRLQSSASSIASGILVGVSAVTSALITLLLTLVLTFFFLKDGHRFLPWMRHLAGPSAGDHLAEVLRRAWETLGGFIRTQAIVGAADGVFIGAGLLIMGVPVAIPLAILTFFGGFVPIIGAFVVGGLAVLVALVSNGWVGALIVFGIILAVQQIEGNILQPILQGKTMRLHAAVILLSVTVGSTLFGIVGAFLAVPVVAVAAVVLRYLDEVTDHLSAQASDRRATPDSRPGKAVPAKVGTEVDAEVVPDDRDATTAQP